MKAQWLERALKLPLRWWRSHCAEVGLVKEILGCINSGKRASRKQKGMAAVVSARSNLVVAINIRDLKFLAVHDTKSLTICFSEENVRDEFQELGGPRDPADAEG